MYQKLSEIFNPVSQQLVLAGSKLSPNEHLRPFHLACAIIDGLRKRAPDWLDLLDGIAIDIAIPEREPFYVLADKEKDYAFMRKARDEVWAAESFTPADLADQDFVNCANAFLREGIDVLRAHRGTAA